MPAPLDSRVERQARVITEAYRREAARLKGYWPSRLLTLSEAMESPRALIPLADGSYHEVDREHLERMAESIPQVLWGLVTIPILLRYERAPDGRARYVVVGDNWQKRAVGLLLRGELTADGLGVLEVSEARVLLARYRSLVFVGLHI